MLRALTAAALAALALPTAASAAPGDLDDGFGAPRGFVAAPAPIARDVLVQPEDGKIVVALSGATERTIRIARYHADGSLDETFNADGLVPGYASLDLHSHETIESARSVARQPDGKYVVTGTADAKLVVVRFTAEGRLDSTFEDDAYPERASVTDLPGDNELGQSVEVDADGRIVVLAQQSGTNRAFVVRHLESGARDVDGFNDDDPATPEGTSALDFGGREAAANALAVEPNGFAVVAGAVKENGVRRLMVARVDSTGDMDTDFDDDGWRALPMAAGDRPDEAHALARLDDGSYVVAGRADSTLESSDVALVKLTWLGRLDTSFGDGDGIAQPDIGSSELVNAIALLDDGRLLTAGATGALLDLRMTLARYLPDGSPDPSFGTGGAVHHDLGAGYDVAASVALQPDGKAVVGGHTAPNTGPEALLARFHGGDPAVESVPDAPEQPSAPPAVPTAPPAAKDTTAPVIGGVTLLRRRFRVARRTTALAAGRRRKGTAFRFTLSEPATVEVKIGRRALVRKLGAGPQRIAFTGRIGKRRLAPGRHRAMLVATDAAGNRSGAKRVRFRVVG